MPEVQTSTQSGEMTQRFIAFVMMHAQQASLFLGEIPHPETGETVRNLDAARFMIDQLEMLQEKTRGNLSSEESQILSSVLSDLRLAFVRITASPGGAASAPATSAESTEPASEPAESEAAQEVKARFRKSYG
jgi:hypothetical protein